MKLIRALVEHPEVIAIGVICLAPNVQLVAQRYLEHREATRPSIRQLLDISPVRPPAAPRLIVRSY